MVDRMLVPTGHRMTPNQIADRSGMPLELIRRIWRALGFLDLADDDPVFTDMVGYTVLSQHLGDQKLAEVVSRFEQLAHDIVTGLGGRVVKMIGDEAMFVVPEVVDAANIGLALSEAYADDDLLSDVRVALAVGPVLVQDGDYYGPVVNLASRLVGIAHLRIVLISDEVHAALETTAPGQFDCRSVRAGSRASADAERGDTVAPELEPSLERDERTAP
jgi:class 3 adenylate cyclase